MNSWRSQSPRSNESGSKPNCVTAVDDLTNWADLQDLAGCGKTISAQQNFDGQHVWGTGDKSAG